MILELIWLCGIPVAIVTSGVAQGRNTLAARREGKQAKPYFIGALLSPAWPVLYLIYGIWFLWKMSNQMGQEQGLALNVEVAALRDFQSKLEKDQERILEELLVKKYGIKEITASTIAEALTQDEAKGSLDLDKSAERVGLQKVTITPGTNKVDLDPDRPADVEILDGSGRPVCRFAYDPEGSRPSLRDSLEGTF